MNRMRFVKHLVGAAFLAVSASAFAGEVPFNQASFDQTVSAGQTQEAAIRAVFEKAL
jgi:thioredoxin 1